MTVVVTFIVATVVVIVVAVVVMLVSLWMSVSVVMVRACQKQEKHAKRSHPFHWRTVREGRLP